MSHNKYNLEDRFIRSRELTGKRDLTSRLGGLAGLQALTQENAKMYTRVWEYLGSFLRNPPELEGWKSEVKNDILYCRRILSQETPPSKNTPSDQNRESMIEKRPDIAHIAQILRERNEEQKKWEKEENFRLPLYKVHLEGTVLISAYLERANLWNAHLEGAVLNDIFLNGAFLKEANLKGTFLIKANLPETTLHKAKLKKADLTYANLEKAFLSEADLEEAILSGSSLEDAILLYANLKRATLCEVRLRDATLDGADLSYANLKEADLSKARLVEANLLETILEGSNITDTDLRGVINFVPDQLKGCWYYGYYDPIDRTSTSKPAGPYGPPSLPEGWNVEEIGIEKRKYKGPFIRDL